MDVHTGVLFLRVFMFTGAIAAVILVLLLRLAADRNYKLGNKSIARFETFLSFLMVFAALLACFFLYYLDSAIPS